MVMAVDKTGPERRMKTFPNHNLFKIKIRSALYVILYYVILYIIQIWNKINASIVNLGIWELYRQSVHMNECVNQRNILIFLKLNH